MSKEQIKDGVDNQQNLIVQSMPGLGKEFFIRQCLMDKKMSLAHIHPKGIENIDKIKEDIKLEKPDYMVVTAENITIAQKFSDLAEELKVPLILSITQLSGKDEGIKVTAFNNISTLKSTLEQVFSENHKETSLLKAFEKAKSSGENIKNVFLDKFLTADSNQLGTKSPNKPKA